MINSVQSAADRLIRMTTGLAQQVEQLLAGPRPLPIVAAGDPVLRRRTSDYDGELSADLFAVLLLAMRETMLAAPGVGLAAPQIGLSLRVAVLEDSALVRPEIAAARERRQTPFRALVNPTYEPIGDERAGAYEGCLSVPGYQAVVPRARVIRLTGWDEAGAALDEQVAGWAARIVAHETDHLNGTLYLDRAVLRSLASADNYLARWSGPSLDPARMELGF